MSSEWNGKKLQDRALRKYGFRDTASAERVLGFINDIQKDIASSHSWPFLKFKMKKLVSVGDHEIDIAPNIPSTPTIALSTTGGIEVNTAIRVKVTYVIFDESVREYNSLESEPSNASDSITTTLGNQGVDISGLSTYPGDETVKPLTIHRRIYLSAGTAPFYLAATIENNTDTTLALPAIPSSVIEPPEYSLVSYISGDDPLIEKSAMTLKQVKLDDITAYDPNFTSSGIPTNYARIAPDKILLYPKPSGTYTLTYWVFRVPSRIFADENRVIQLHHSLKEALDAGVTWKGYEDKDQDGQESKKTNYIRIRDSSKGILGRNGGMALSVKVVC